MRIAYLTGIQWDSLWQRPHALAEAWSKEHDVVVVEGPLPLADAIKQPRRALAQLGRWLAGGFRVHENLRVLSPFPLRLPLGRRWAVVAAINDAALCLSLRWLRWRTGRDSFDLLVTALPDMLCAVDALDSQTVVYDCVDEHSAFTSGGADALSKREARLCQRVDAVAVVSERLAKQKRAYSPQVRVIRNGVGDSFVEAGRNEPALTQDGGRKKIGFVGAVYPWVDIELIDRLAQARPGYDVIIVGPVATDVECLRHRPNVTLVPPQPHGHLPQLIAKFDVCILPFRVNSLTRSSNPVKLYEYLALGKPVVATPIDEMATFQGLVRVAATAEEFLSQVDAAAAEGCDPEANTLRQRRLTFAVANTWQARADEFIHLAQAREQLEGGGLSTADAG